MIGVGPNVSFLDNDVNILLVYLGGEFFIVFKGVSKNVSLVVVLELLD